MILLSHERFKLYSLNISSRSNHSSKTDISVVKLIAGFTPKNRRACSVWEPHIHLDLTRLETAPVVYRTFRMQIFLLEYPTSCPLPTTKPYVYLSSLYSVAPWRVQGVDSKSSRYNPYPKVLVKHRKHSQKGQKWPSYS